MDHQYGIPEIQQLMKGGERTTATAPSPSTTSSHFPSDFFGFNLAPPPPPRHHRLHQFTTDQEMGFLPLGILGLGGSSSNLNGNPSGGGGGGVGFSGFLEGGGFGGGGVGGDGGGTGRWPRQETLTLLEIRSRLDHKFKEANQKGPLWDEVSRIMSEEHGYQRSGKKCREKFENLYKYYKKTKEGKAGRQDGKHYRFFRQLEALYGDSNNLVSCPNLNTHFMSNALHEHHGLQGQNTMMNVTNVDNNVHGYHHQSLSLSNNYNSSELELMTSSSEGNDDSSSRRKKRSWKAKIKDFIDLNMKKLIERQDVWLEKLTKVIEDKEEQRMLKEEERRKIEASRLEREHMFWAKERKRMEARDVAVIEALQCLTGKTLLKPLCSSPQERLNGNNSDQTMTNNVSIKGNSSSTCWSEQEVIKLMEIRSSMESAFQEILSGCSDEFLWEEIAAKMIRLGFDQRSALSCKEKWECISNGMIIKEKKLMINKKRKENSSSCGVYYPRTEENLVSEVQGNNVSSASTSNANANAENPSGAMAAGTNCFPFLMGDGDQNLWESYGLRLSKGENQ